ncbi:MAG: hypothetical protein MUE71_10170 [Chitinophagaceae bacterium]|nr:hypothetical protein [Chitinophagaceae bacterium]
MYVLINLISVFTSVFAQDESIDSSKHIPPVNFTAQQAQQNMMEQLGIKMMRPGLNSDEKAPNAANYNEEKANPCPALPEALMSKAGQQISNPEMWWKVRRPEIIEDFEKEIYGRIPASVPKVQWKVTITDREFIGRIPATVKKIIGHVDNSSYPLINVDINMILVVPSNVKGPVPVLMMFGFPSFPAPAQPSPADMEKINNAFRDLMIKKVSCIFSHHPVAGP